MNDGSLPALEPNFRTFQTFQIILILLMAAAFTQSLIDLHPSQLKFSGTRAPIDYASLVYVFGLLPLPFCIFKRYQSAYLLTTLWSLFIYAIPWMDIGFHKYEILTLKWSIAVISAGLLIYLLKYEPLRKIKKWPPLFVWTRIIFLGSAVLSPLAMITMVLGGGGQDSVAHETKYMFVVFYPAVAITAVLTAGELYKRGQEKFAQIVALLPSVNLLYMLLA